MVVDKVVPDKGETAKEAFVKWRKWADDKVGVRPSRGVGWLTKYLKNNFSRIKL